MGGEEGEGEREGGRDRSERWREQGLHDDWPGRPAALRLFGWKERRERSEEGAVGSSQQVSEPERVDLGALGSLTDCGVSQTLPRMEWAGKHRDFQVRSAPGWDCFSSLPGRSLRLFSGRQASVCMLCSAQGLGLRNDVMLQQLDSISLRRREAASFLDFANLADLTLAEPEVFRLHYRNHHLTFI